MAIYPARSRDSRTSWLVTLYAGGGEFCDGYILSIIGVALPSLADSFQLQASSLGLMGAAALVGMCIGAPIFGYVTDRVGRQKIYLFDIAAFIVLSALQFIATEPWQLMLLRFLMGVAIGADFAIAGTMVSEFASPKSRGPLLIVLSTLWSLGAAVAYIVGWLMITNSDDPNIWRWVLASSTVPSILILLLRLGTPESPRWLLSKGRPEEALAALRKISGPDANLGDIAVIASAPSRYSTIFRPPYRRHTIFICVFWACQVLPIYAISTYQPMILKSFGFTESNYLGAAVVQAFYVFGSMSGALFINRSRRKLLLSSFVIAAGALATLAFTEHPPLMLVIAMFIVFGVSIFAAQGLEHVYPSELFPTRVRATAKGFVSGASRIGAAIGAYGAPLLLTANIQLAMGVGATVCLLGWLMSYYLAPETRGLTLEQASGEANLPDSAAAHAPASR